MIEYLKKLFDKLLHRKEKQYTLCYCPTCGNELTESDSEVRVEELVTFRCNECYTITDWLFDAPAPILLYVNGEKYDHWNTKEVKKGHKRP